MWAHAPQAVLCIIKDTVGEVSKRSLSCQVFVIHQRHAKASVCSRASHQESAIFRQNTETHRGIAREKFDMDGNLMIFTAFPVSD